MNFGKIREKQHQVLLQRREVNLVIVAYELVEDVGESAILQWSDLVDVLVTENDITKEIANQQLAEAFVRYKKVAPIVLGLQKRVLNSIIEGATSPPENINF